MPLREAAKKVLLLMARPLRPNPPPPSSIMAIEILERWEKRLKKVLEVARNYYKVIRNVHKKVSGKFTLGKIK